MFGGKRIGTFQEALALMNCRRLPARLNTTETAVVLGFQEHDIAALVAAKLLVPLGKPAANAPKYFAAIDVMEFGQNRDWLSRATRVLASHWIGKNRRKSEESAKPSLEGLPIPTRTAGSPLEFGGASALVRSHPPRALGIYKGAGGVAPLVPTFAKPRIGLCAIGGLSAWRWRGVGLRWSVRDWVVCLRGNGVLSGEFRASARGAIPVISDQGTKQPVWRPCSVKLTH